MKKIFKLLLLLSQLAAFGQFPDLAKTGLMFRESMSVNSKFALICITPGNGISLQWRDSTGGNCEKKDFREEVLPLQFTLERKAEIFSAYKSTDGKKWQLLGNVTLKQGFSDKYPAGLLVLSHSSHHLNVSKFDQGDIQAIENK